MDGPYHDRPALEEAPPDEDRTVQVSLAVTGRYCPCGREIEPDPKALRRGAELVIDVIRRWMLGGRIMKLEAGGARTFTHRGVDREIAELEREAGVDLV